MLPIALAAVAAFFLIGAAKKRERRPPGWSGAQLSQAHPELAGAFASCLMYPQTCPRSSADSLATQLEALGYYYEAGQLREAAAADAFPVG
jgi:hypothetical protein